MNDEVIPLEKLGKIETVKVYNQSYVNKQQKRITELEREISILLSCNSCPDNKGGLLCQKEYEEKCLAQKIQYIKELEKENAELKEVHERDKRSLALIAKKVADFNKANEWHKPSEKLPERCSLVLAYAFDDTEPSLYKFVTNDQWEWMPRRITFLSNDQIRLWKEIELPKEIKEK